MILKKRAEEFVKQVEDWAKRILKPALPLSPPAVIIHPRSLQQAEHLYVRSLESLDARAILILNTLHILSYFNDIIPISRQVKTSALYGSASSQRQPTTKVFSFAAFWRQNFHNCPRIYPGLDRRYFLKLQPTKATMIDVVHMDLTLNYSTKLDN